MKPKFLFALAPLLAAIGLLAVAQDQPRGNASLGKSPDTPNPPRQYFVATDGSPTADGSRDHPWNLNQLLTHPPRTIRPGDVIWVRGGVYRGPLVSNLSGTAEAPITVRAYGREHVLLDLYNPNQWEQAFFVQGDHVTYQGFEVTTSNPGPRTTMQNGPFQTDVNRGGISVRGHFNKFVNLVVHDLNAGIGYWGNGGEIHGSIIYNNGWKAPDRQHGHGLYLQNDSDLKSITDNIIFNQFGAGIHAFGSAKASLNNLSFEGNVAFNNGAGAGEGFDAERDILVGGSCAVRRARLHQNFTFQNGLDGVVDLGYLWGPENEDVTVTENYIAGTVRFLQPWSSVVFVGNTVVSGQPISVKSPSGGTVKEYRWDQNRYASAGQVYFTVDDEGRGWEAWRADTGFDADSTLESTIAESQVFVRPNRYEPGRANVIVYNWGRASQVDVDLSAVLKVGDRFELFSATDFFGEPVLQGVFDGNPIRVPMIDRPAPSPMGYAEAAAVGTDARFGVFVVRSGREGQASPAADRDPT